MIKVLHLVSSLTYSGKARQLSWLAPRFASEGIEQTVVALDDPAPWTETMLEQGISAQSLGWRHAIDVRPWLRLRGLLDEVKPDVVHAWGMSAVRCLSTTSYRLADTIASFCLPASGEPNLVDRMALRRVGRFLAFSQTESQRLQAVGVDSSRITLSAPGVPHEWASQPESESPTPEIFARFDPGSRVLLGIGTLERTKGFFDAIYALDMLHFIYNDVQLILIGTGPEQTRLETLAAGVRMSVRLHIVEDCKDVRPYLHRATCLWAPVHVATSTYPVLEAMSLDIPVVASHLPHLAEIVDHGRTGILVKPGDKMSLARETRLLFDDAPRQQALATAGRKHVREKHALDPLLARCVALYGEEC